jgi:acyl dehydratase
MKAPAEFYLKVGDEVTLEREVTPRAVDGFADISGDHSPNHTDDAMMTGSAYKGRIAHGALLVAYMSACSTEIVERIPNVRATETPVSLGYDRIRFIRPVYIGDRIKLHYQVRAIDPARRRAISDITIANQDGHTVCVGEHILKWVT